jgi:tetratricopeptide (TPR) repeat protein
MSQDRTVGIDNGAQPEKPHPPEGALSSAEASVLLNLHEATAGDVTGEFDSAAKEQDAASADESGQTGQRASPRRREPANEQTLALPDTLPKAADPTEQTLGLPVVSDANEQTLGLPAAIRSAADAQNVATIGAPGEIPVAAAPESSNSEPSSSAVKTRLQTAGSAGGVAKRSSAQVHVPGYEILSVLGRGGMGVVYKAKHLRLNRLVALKMILSGAHASEADLARFLIEAKAIAQLQHPNIVAIYEIGEHEGRPFFSLEYLDGGSLQGKMNGVPMPPREAAQMVAKVARAVHFAHEHGIIHRDLKPANVLLTQHGEPKLTDFGLAKEIDAQDAGHTGTEAVLGTPSYMAPEQAAGQTKQMGPPGDIYALGAVLYDALTGRPPFRGATLLETLQQVQNAEPLPPSKLVPTLPSDLQTICLKALEKPPAKRYATAAALADDLQRFLDGVPIHARPTSPWERAYKWTRRNPVLAALSGCIVAAVVALGLFVAWHNISLQEELAQARADERAARQREQDALESERLSRLQADGKQLLHEAHVSVAGRDWPSARLHLTKALASIGGAEQLAALKDSAEVLLQQVEHELRVETERQTSKDQLQKFRRLCDDAQFLGTLYTGMDLAANLKATRAAVQQALAVYGVSVQDSPPALDPYLDAAQKSEVLADLYQLFLILAETEAQSAPDAHAAASEHPVREALRLLQQALRFGAPSRAWHLRQARYLGLLGDRAGAGQAEKAAAEAAVVQVFDHFLVADEFYRRASFDEALKEFDQVLQRRPDHFWAQYLSAMCLLRQRRFAEARTQLTACLAQRGDFVWIYLQRGYAQGELRDHGAAEADFAKALQLPLDESARYVLFVNRGVVRVRHDRCDDAVADLKTAIALKPKEYQAYVNLAQAYLRQKKLDPALEQLHLAIKLEPNLAQLYRLRARLHLERKEPALAVPDFEQAIRREQQGSPFLAEDHVEYGRLLLHDGKYAAALASFDAGLAARPSYPLAQRLRAEALFQLGRFREVIEAFDRYLQTGKPLESVYRGRGLARAELGQYPGAIEDYTKALELQPSAAVLAYRGWAHLVCEAPKLALRDFELALELDAKNADAHNGRGIVLASQGRAREAVKAAEAALRHGAMSPRLLYNAARIHALCEGHERRALDLIREAVELLPAGQRGAFWSKYIRSDTALQAIRGYPQFQQLDAAMEAAGYQKK